MDRRRFLQTVAASAAAANALETLAQPTRRPKSSPATTSGTISSGGADVEGHTLICSFSRKDETWKVYEDLRTRDGAITFISSKGVARVLPKSAEQTFADDGPQHLGLDIKDIGMAARDLLAEKLLANGDPKEDEVRRAAPPMNSTHREGPNARPTWNTFVGTRECSDTMPVYPSGNTRTYHPVQYFRELTQERANKRYEGLIGGWLPAVRKVMPGDGDSYYEVTVFGDVLATDRFIVQTWHRTVHVDGGKITKAEYGYSYPAYTRRRQEPTAEEFFRGMLEFAEYWERQMADMANVTLPDASWTNMARYAFVKELMVRPGGTYPKYGAVDRDYYGPEYDGFQDIFTMSFYANMECGRLDVARAIFDGYFTDFTDAKGMINMRGPETAQFGLTLHLIAHYYDLTGDRALLLKHREKIEATASLLRELQDEALKLPETDRGHGLIHGWCESDACLAADPSLWWKPYYANSAFAVRGWRDIAGSWRKAKFPGAEAKAADWEQRADRLHQQLLKSIDANTKHDMSPPYVPLLPGSPYTFREAMDKERPSEQQWSHRCYTELLQANVLPAAQANTVIDTMRSYGATTIGVVANVGRANPNGRAILGFISYGYAQMLLQLGRIEEYILFLYAHRYHDHSRGSWTAGEVAGISGGGALFCIPAQQTVPLLVRWMLVFEESDANILHLGRAIPRDWIASGKPIGIEGAPTRYGRVTYRLETRENDVLAATVSLPQAGALPKELHVAFRVPRGRKISGVTVNGKPGSLRGAEGETAVIPPEGQRKFEVIAHLA
ncbi:MAG TPA: hypothetical protein VJU82_17145 [Acidobacteriaceae bacterium]|nr:hypothetical protein [Acidobacteriaceae bacterium]